jgi:hypothetical protein
MEDVNIAEVRGVADNQQNIEGNMTDIAEEKMNKLPGKEKYQKISKDMKKMTDIYKKCFQKDKQTGERSYLNPKLEKDELLFLYEMNSKIEGFGYKKDPRIEEIQKIRNPKEDAPIIFECEPNQVAYNKNEINKNTKVYLGPLFKGIFKMDIEHMGASLLDGMIKKMEVEIRGNSKKELIKKLKENSPKIWGLTKEVLSTIDNLDFISSKKSEHINLVCLTLNALGFSDYDVRNDEIYEKAKKLGLELCPAEVGPGLRLQYTDQPDGEYLYIGMKPIINSSGVPQEYTLSSDVGELMLNVEEADYRYRSKNRKLVFLLPH